MKNYSAPVYSDSDAGIKSFKLLIGKQAGFMLVVQSRTQYSGMSYINLQRSAIRSLAGILIFVSGF